MAIGLSDAETFWTTFPRSLARCGLRGVKVVIADDHKGLKGRHHPDPRRNHPALSRPPHAYRAHIHISEMSVSVVAGAGFGPEPLRLSAGSHDAVAPCGVRQHRVSASRTVAPLNSRRGQPSAST